MVETRELDLGGRALTVQVGKVAKQAGGAVTLRVGDTIVLTYMEAVAVSVSRQ